MKMILNFRGTYLLVAIVEAQHSTWNKKAMIRTTFWHQVIDWKRLTTCNGGPYITIMSLFTSVPPYTPAAFNAQSYPPQPNTKLGWLKRKLGESNGVG